MPAIFDRRAFLASVAALTSAPAITPVFAQSDVITVRPGGAFRPVRVAVVPFAGDPDAARLFTSVISNNFKRSVFLQPVDPGSFPEPALGPDQPPNIEAWKTVNAQYVLVGRAQRSGGGRQQAEFRLWDVASGKQASGQQYATDANVSRRVAHIMSDQVFSRITGEKGFFDTRVVFVDETGPANRRRKRLAVMDQDGAGVQYLTAGNDLAVTPRFSPSSQDVAYMAFGGDEPRVMIMNLDTRQREAVGNFPGMTFAPRFSPDGQKIVMSLSKGNNSTLYAMDLRSRSTTRLTDSAAIDTSPSYSPDGARIVFESDRGGTQQIYVMSASGGGATRISFGDGRYSTPVWSPKGDYIAFTRQSKNGFGIGVMKPDGSGERILTEGYHNEGPTWAPNGLFLMFFRDPGGGAPKIHMTDVYGRSDFVVPTPSFASDPAWGPLLN
ncbi:MAG: Tol-Pal system protein TolB [Rhodoblastus sp.]|nr:Tol-Pal system protein TolB [Rhodoblastus sp.]